MDEVQEHWPTDRGNTPEWIKHLSRHRHCGLDFVIATQDPAMISTYVRRLCDEHIHLKRKFKSKVVERYENSEVQLDTTSRSALKSGSRSI